MLTATLGRVVGGPAPIAAVLSGRSRSTRRLFWCLSFAIGITVAGGGALTAVAVRRLAQPVRPPAVRSLDVFAVLYDQRPTAIVTTAGWQKIRMTVPRWQLLSDETIWRRMHFEDWDRVAAGARNAGLAELLRRDGAIVTAVNRWPQMTADDWDRVPQPVRAMAFVGMIEYWADRYALGARFGLARDDVVRTVKSIAMSESWFDHRAVSVNPDGSADIGLGGASAFARRVLRRWRAKGQSDFALDDEDYGNPWLAARALVFWFDEMLQESDGDLDLAIRAYNRGIGRARRGAGEEYLRAVRRREASYFEQRSQSPTWRALSRWRRAQLAPGRAEPLLFAFDAGGQQTAESPFHEGVQMQLSPQTIPDRFARALPRGFRLVKRQRHDFLLVESLFCPNGHNLIVDTVRIHNEASVKLKVVVGGETGFVFVDPFWGSHAKLFSFLAFRSSEEPLYANAYCPTCSVSLVEHYRCSEEGCGSQQGIRLTLPGGNNTIHVCARLGCPGHLLDVTDTPNDVVRAVSGINYFGEGGDDDLGSM